MASAQWEKRNARARALGYDSYYDYRAHDYGRLAPSAPRASGDLLASLRGHRSASDLKRLLRSGRVDLVNTVSTIDNKGKLVVDVLATLDDGSQREFRLRGAQVIALGAFIDDMGTDAPPLVGSPRTLSRITGEEPDVIEEQAIEPGEVFIELPSGKAIEITDVAGDLQ